MASSYKRGLVIGLVGVLLMPLAPAQAGMVNTEEVLHHQDRARLAGILERDEVRQQLIELGVDPASAKARVQHMTDEEVAQLNGRISELPAGAGVSRVELLLFIIIIILLI